MDIRIFEVGEKYVTEDSRVFYNLVENNQFPPTIWRQGWREELPEQPYEPIEEVRTSQQLQLAFFAHQALGVPFEPTPEETGVIATESGQGPIADGQTWKPGLNLAAGTIVTENGKNFIVRDGKGHISQPGWNPSNTPALFEQIRDPYAEWVQPTGGHDAYMLGDRVLWQDEVWKSTINNNVWQPGIHGWERA